MNRGFLILIFLSKHLLCYTQDSLLVQLHNDSSWEQTPALGTSLFKATQIINTVTVEAPPRKNLQFMIMHRFGKISEGGYALFGLDNATIRFALDYGLTDNFSIGIGRSSLEKVYDASFKWNIIQQASTITPISVSLYGLAAHTTLKYSDKPYLDARFRTMYTTQLLVAKKISQKLSLQLTPSWVHLNLVPTPGDKNDLLTLGLGGRFKITNRISLNGDYHYISSNQIDSYQFYNPLSLGLDIETGGHVFQFVFTNSHGMIAPYYLTKTIDSWRNGDIYFGFNITRLFTLKK
jgi:hypothetical protein